MEEKDASEGIEVTHPTHGRGFVSTYHPQFGAEPDEATVQFYDGGEHRLPVYVLESAAEVTTASVTTSSTGFRATVDDGYYTIVLRPDGSGGGYTVELLEEGRVADTVTLSGGED